MFGVDDYVIGDKNWPLNTFKGKSSKFLKTLVFKVVEQGDFGSIGLLIMKFEVFAWLFVETWNVGNFYKILRW